MKKRFVFLVMAFIVCHGLNAQNSNEMKYLNLVLPDCSLVSYTLADGIDIHFQDSIMVVNDMNFFMDDMVKYYFSEEGNLVVSENESDNVSYVSGERLFVKSYGVGNIVISDLLGRVVYNKPNCKECIVDLSSFERDILYVIKVNSQTIKFIRR